MEEDGRGWAPSSSTPNSSARRPPELLRTPSASDSFHQSLASPTALSRGRGRVVYGDRFIPSRASSARLEYSPLEREIVASEQRQRGGVAGVGSGPEDVQDSSPAYNMLLRASLLGCELSTPISGDKASQLEQLRQPASPGKKIFRYVSGDRLSPRAGGQAASPYSVSPVGGDNPLGAAVASPRRTPRKIPRGPFKVLDAPQLQDDFYLNLVDWSSQNVLAVGLGACVYLWSACTCKVTKLCDLGDSDPVCSVAWSQRGTYLSVGTNAGDTQIWDVSKLKRLRTMAGHRARVGTMAWSSHMLSTGSRDRLILQRDVRVAEAYTHKCAAHRSEVCGLRWSPDDRQLASGGNDNQLYVWNLHGSAPVLRFSEHTAAVKAIAWSPHQHGLLASGGGTADRCIRFWNTCKNAPLNCVDTGSQVCNLAWSKNVNEIVSTHGYSQNQIIIWKHPTMAKLATLTGHTYRVLYLAVSPDGQTIVTGAGDETLRFWNTFPGPKSQGSSDTSISMMMRTHIR